MAVTIQFSKFCVQKVIALWNTILVAGINQMNLDWQLFSDGRKARPNGEFLLWHCDSKAITKRHIYHRNTCHVRIVRRKVSQKLSLMFRILVQRYLGAVLFEEIFDVPAQFSGWVASHMVNWSYYYSRCNFTALCTKIFSRAPLFALLEDTLYWFM